jgi:hypothetical protein
MVEILVKKIFYSQKSLILNCNFKISGSIDYVQRISLNFKAIRSSVGNVGGLARNSPKGQAFSLSILSNKLKLGNRDRT